MERHFDINCISGFITGSLDRLFVIFQLLVMAQMDRVEELERVANV